MKKQLFIAVAVTALMAVPSLASADDPGWYVRGNVGYGSITDVDLVGDLAGDLEGEGNGAGSLGLGYDFGNNWRVELDAAQLWNDLGAITQASNTSADMRITTGMINALYDFSDFGAWEPYIGAGIGLARTSLSAQAHSFPNPPILPINNSTCTGFNNCSIHDSDTATAWQLIAGLGYKINDNLTWDTQYRYLNVGKLDYTGQGSNLTLPTLTTLGNPAEITTVASGAGGHVLMTGLRYRFGASTPTPPTPTYTCWDSSTVENLANCPAQPPAKVYISCWDGSQVESGSTCPSEPVVQCWDGTTVNNAAACPVQPATVRCWDGSMVYDQVSCPVQTYEQQLCANEYRQEIIYYNFNKGQSAETQEKIQRILDTGKYCAVGNINVIGHTDSSGAASYNLGLSKRRAADVRKELVRQGIAGALITSEGKGETQLFIDTGDGVKEQLNRRTEVLIRLNQTGVVN